LRYSTKYSLKLIIFILAAVFSVSSCFGMDSFDIIKRVEDNLNGETAAMKFAMSIKTKRGERTMKMDSYSVGSDLMFIKVTYPKKDKGITFLKVDKSMWQYVPRIEKIIKIPASMMLQSWMGSDFSNGDLVKESSLSKDYTHKLIRESDTEFELELTPLTDAPVVWGRITMTVTKEFFLPALVQYFDEDNILVRILHYNEVRNFNGRYYPSLWVMEPQLAEKKGRSTVIEVYEAEFDQPVNDSYFTKRGLKRFSK
jgi:outer membrane lipoprotein-sorting protein